MPERRDTLNEMGAKKYLGLNVTRRFDFVSRHYEAEDTVFLHGRRVPYGQTADRPAIAAQSCVKGKDGK